MSSAATRENDPKYARVPVIAVIGANQQRQFVRLGAQFRVKDPEAAVKRSG